jgi:selT/selW/selH-like putative selenoprotein
LEDAIRSELDLQPVMIAGKGGIFDVKVDGNLVFSKHKVGRFPEHSEILDAIAKVK